jgi:hypothetical protein
MNEGPPIPKRKRFLLLSASEWVTTVIALVALVLLLLSYDLVLIRGNPSAGPPGGCYHTLSLTPGMRWIPPLQPYFSIGILAAGIIIPTVIARRRNNQ